MLMQFKTKTSNISSWPNSDSFSMSLIVYAIYNIINNLTEVYYTTLILFNNLHSNCMYQ